MAKKRKATLGDLIAGDSAYEAIFAGMTDAAKLRFPGQVYSGTEAEQLMVCLPVPSIALRYLLQQEGWPLGRFTMLVGEQETCKSALAYEIIRWHRHAHGVGIYIDTEYKPAPELMYSILEYDYKAITYQKCRTLDEWQQATLGWLEDLKKRMDGDGTTPGFGRIVPVCMAVDSVTAAMDGKAYEKLMAVGHSENRFADEARHLTMFLKVITKEIDAFPFTVVGVNHLKPGTTPTGIPTRNIGGGKGLRFHEATEIEMRRKSSINPTTKSGQLTRHHRGHLCEGIELQICTTKNSNAPHKYIDVEMLWYTDYEATVETRQVDPATGEVRIVAGHPQRTFFDWHAAAIDIILSIQKERSRQSKLLADVLVIEGGDDRRYCYSKTLGVTEKGKVSWSELGEILETRLAADPSFADALYPLLGIRRRFMYRPGVDYRELVATASAATLVPAAAATAVAEGGE